MLEVERDKPLDEQLFILLKTVCLESDFLTADEIAFSKRVAILSSSELLSLVDKLLAKYDNFIDDTVGRRRDNVCHKCISYVVGKLIY